MGEFLSAICGGALVVVAQLGYQWWQVDRPRKQLEEQQKELLLKLLDPTNMPKTNGGSKAEWRGFNTLSGGIGADDVVAKKLLIEVGARRSTGQKDVWALIKHKPLEDAENDEGEA